MEEKPNFRSIYNKFIKLVDHYLPTDSLLVTQAEGNQDQPFDGHDFNLVFQNSPIMVFILNYATMQYDFFSSNVKAILGYSADKYLAKDGMSFAISTFHPDERALIMETVYAKALEFYRKHKRNKGVEKLKITISFRVRQANGQYIWMQQTVNVIHTTPDGSPLSSILYMTDITHLKKDNAIDFIVSQKDSNGLYMPIYVASYPSKDKCHQYSKRELEVMSLVSQGKKSSEIAELLSLSVHTVSNHRKNLRTKAGVDSLFQLLRFD